MFSFGKNWKQFSKSKLTKELVQQARDDFAVLTEGLEFSGKSFLDIGFGQGLALCLAQEKGAQVLGIDIDSENVDALQATAQLFELSSIPATRIDSILDISLIEQLTQQGPFDIVHSWGVLHHTGNLKQALQNVIPLVKPGGHLVVAIYAAHWTSPYWKAVKYTYNILPSFGQRALALLFYPFLLGATKFFLSSKSSSYARGMDFYTDVIDWIGGYPYEYAKRVEIEAMLEQNSFVVEKWLPPLVPTGNNQWVFRKA